MKAALVVKFSNPVPGRERAALDYAREIDDFARKNADGGISEPKWYWSSSGENMLIAEGEYETLLKVTSTPEAQKLETKGMLLMQDFHDELVVVGRDEGLGVFDQSLTELGIK